MMLESYMQVPLLTNRYALCHQTPSAMDTMPLSYGICFRAPGDRGKTR
jgi:hypothetical protein